MSARGWRARGSASKRSRYSAKWNGAVGNYNAQSGIARPTSTGSSMSREFVESQQLAWNPYTTQIEPHDWIARVLRCLRGCQRDPDRSVPRPVGLHQPRLPAAARRRPGRSAPRPCRTRSIRSTSRMPRATSASPTRMLRFFADKLPISRWQRDLTDSTVLRNLGVALAHALIGWQALQRGLTKLSPDRGAHGAGSRGRLRSARRGHPERAARARALPNGYELLRDLHPRTAHRRRCLRALRRKACRCSAAERQRLIALRPADYVGLAAELARASPLVEAAGAAIGRFR